MVPDPLHGLLMLNKAKIPKGEQRQIRRQTRDYGYDPQQIVDQYGQQQAQGHGQQHGLAQKTPVLWSLAGWSGVTGFSGVCQATRLRKAK